MNIIEITKMNTEILEKFISNKQNMASSFRYFEKRTIDVINNHILTVVLTDTNNEVIGYGHIDHDGKYWLGICLLNGYTGKGYGKLIMDHLLNHPKVRACQCIHLSVDKSNEIAIKLYQKYNFNIIKDCGTYYLMNLNFVPDI